jgi:hypothetical protein
MKTKLNMSSLLTLKINIHVGFTNRKQSSPNKNPHNWKYWCS